MNPIYHCNKKNKISRNKLKGTKEPYTENYKTLMKEIKDDINRGGDIPCSWVGRFNIVKMTILPNAIYRFHAIPIKLPIAFFTVLKQKISQSIWKHKRPRIAKAVLRKKNGAGSINLSWLQMIQQSYSHQDCMVLTQNQKYRPMEQDRKPRNKPTHLWRAYFWQRRQEYIQWDKDSFFNKLCWDKWTVTCKRIKLEHFLTPYSKINSKWMK